jgi:4-nitrophenyl phosphatase
MDIQQLKGKKLFVLDMDGTFYLGDTILDGSLDFIRKIRDVKKQFLFFTNNASKTAADYCRKLNKMNCNVQKSNILTSGNVTIEYLHKKYRNSSVYLVGTPLLKKSFIDNGINIVEKAPDIVVVSFDTTLTYQKILKACRFIQKGAQFVATHNDFNCPVEEGFMPDCGAICALITASTGVKPRFLGKPFNETIEMISSVTGYSKNDMVIIGDRLYTDIAMGVRNGVTAILVLTGETKKSDLKYSKVQPDFVFSSIKEIIQYL